MSSALAVFVRLPRPGRVKTRLAASIGNEAAAGLYRALAQHVLEATTPRTGEYERLVFFDPPEAGQEMRALLPGVRLPAQSGDDIGARLADAFARAFARGARRAALVATRSTPAGLEHLRRLDTVIAERRATLFRNLSPSELRTLRATLEKVIAGAEPAL